MTLTRTFGLVVLAAGITALVIGINASDSASEQIREGFTGHYSDKTMWFIIVGVCGTVAGGGLAAFGRKVLG